VSISKISFVEDNKQGTPKSNELLIQEIDQLDRDSSDYATRLCELIFLLVTKKPIITNYIKLDSRTAWFSYMKENRLPANSMMANVLKFLGKNGSGVCDWVFQLYESDYANTRFLVHYLNSLEGEDKVPYLKIALQTISKHMFGSPLSSIEVLKRLVEIPENELMMELILLSKEVGGLKRIGGETNTDCNTYTWIADGFDRDKEFIERADVAYDIGGGFCTPYLSMLFDKEMVSLDKIQPSIAQEHKIKIVLPPGIKQRDYYQLLERQKWEYFDVYESEINDSYSSYFITSFGFATSTVSPSKLEKDSELSSEYTTYFAMKSVSDLIAKGKDVYFFFYGRPTTKVFHNKIVSMKFINKKLEYYNIYSDPYSSKNEHNFGLNKQVAYRAKNTWK